MRKSIVIWLSIASLIVQWGCAHAPPYPQPPSEEVRAALGTIGVVSAAAPEEQLKGPTSGKLHSTGKGFGKGIGKGAAFGFAITGLVVGVPLAVLLPPLAPFIALGVGAAGAVGGAAVGGPIGSFYGAFAGESATTVKEAEAALNKALDELKVQETMRDRVLQVARDKSPHTFVLLQDQAPYSSLADKGIDTVLEIGVERLVLEGSGINPPLALVMSARARLIRVPDGTELYLNTLVYHSRKRKLTDWAADDAQPFREEVDRAYQGLTERFVEYLFLEYHFQ